VFDFFLRMTYSERRYGMTLTIRRDHVPMPLPTIGERRQRYSQIFIQVNFAHSVNVVDTWRRSTPYMPYFWPSHRCSPMVSLLLMTHKYMGCIIVLSINKSVESNEEQKVLMSGLDQGFTVNTSKRVFRGIWQYK
jgi:hypothetical protein